MNRLLKLTSILEAATGLALIAAPAAVVRLLLGGDISGASIALGRVAGFGLLSLGLACWPGRDSASNTAPARAMLTYNVCWYRSLRPHSSVDPRTEGAPATWVPPPRRARGLEKRFRSMSPSTLGESNIQLRKAWKLYARKPGRRGHRGRGLTITDATRPMNLS